MSKISTTGSTANNVTDTVVEAVKQPLTKYFAAPITKAMQKSLEDGSLLVKGAFTSDQKDMLGDMITRAATEKAVPAYRRWGNIRYMHMPRPVGKVQRIGSDDGLAWNEVEFKVWDPEIIRDIENGLLSALSVGILIDWDDIDFMADGGLLINDYLLSEISLVDHPANYDAALSTKSMNLEEARMAKNGTLITTEKVEKDLDQETVDAVIDEAPVEAEIIEEVEASEDQVEKDLDTEEVVEEEEIVSEVEEIAEEEVESETVAETEVVEDVVAEEAEIEEDVLSEETVSAEIEEEVVDEVEEVIEEEEAEPVMAMSAEAELLKAISALNENVKTLSERLEKLEGNAEEEAPAEEVEKDLVAEEPVAPAPEAEEVEADEVINRDIADSEIPEPVEDEPVRSESRIKTALNRRFNR